MNSTDSLPEPGRPTVAEAMSELNRACQAAGLKIQLTPSKTRFGRYLGLGEVTPETALRLVELIQHQLTEAHETAEELWGVFQRHGLDMPTPYVLNSRICLGDVGIETADRLAILLGAASRAEPSATGWAVGQETADRLSAAFKEATGEVLDVLFHPDCLRCDNEAAISLRSVPVETAHRLGQVLRVGGRS